MEFDFPLMQYGHPLPNGARCTQLQGYCRRGSYCNLDSQRCQPMNFQTYAWRGDDPRWSYTVYRRFGY
jgi:hypothetical protein